MTRNASIVLALVGLSALAVTACSSGDVPVGATNTSTQDLKKNKDGSSTGNGSTCSWDQSQPSTSPSSGSGAAGDTPVDSGNAIQGNVGEAVPSPDTCNDCSCTAQGIVCTVRECAPVACPDLAKQCSDGSYVGATGPNCAFECPDDPHLPVACPEDAKLCPDGSSVGRSGPTCEFDPCPSVPVACAQDAKLCPDGTYVSRSGPNCTFPACK